MPQLMVEKGPDKGLALMVRQDQVHIIGRDPGASMVLTDRMCSRNHFRVVFEQNQFFVEDLGSANGTSLNAQPLSERRPITYGDQIQAGMTLFSFLSSKEGKKKGGLVGRTLGGYEIIERVGRGGMGTVYKARQVSLDRVVALKILGKELTRDRSFIDLFQKEARSAARLNHPNILSVHDVGEADGYHFISMEFAGGGSLEDLIKQRAKVPFAEAGRMMIECAEALFYAEKQKIVHRDVKPDNFMLTGDGTVKLGDLGLAHNVAESGEQTGGVFGTPYYIAPEQALGKAIDHRADIYALGGTFFRLLTGRHLFEGASVKEILRQQVKEPPDDVRTVEPSVPDPVAAIIHRCLEKEPEKRFPSCADLIAALKQAAARGETGVEPAVKLNIAALVQNKRQLVAVASAAAVVLVLAAAGIIFLFTGGASPATPPVTHAGSPGAGDTGDDADATSPRRRRGRGQTEGGEGPGGGAPPTLGAEMTALSPQEAADKRDRDADRRWQEIGPTVAGPADEAAAAIDKFLSDWAGTKAAEEAKKRLEAIRATQDAAAKADESLVALDAAAAAEINQREFGRAMRRYQQFAEKNRQSAPAQARAAEEGLARVREAARASLLKDWAAAGGLMLSAVEQGRAEEALRARAMFERAARTGGFSEVVSLALDGLRRAEETERAVAFLARAGPDLDREAEDRRAEAALADTESAVLAMRFSDAARQVRAAKETMKTPRFQTRFESLAADYDLAETAAGRMFEALRALSAPIAFPAVSRLATGVSGGDRQGLLFAREGGGPDRVPWPEVAAADLAQVIDKTLAPLAAASPDANLLYGCGVVLFSREGFAEADRYLAAAVAAASGKDRARFREKQARGLLLLAQQSLDLHNAERAEQALKRLTRDFADTDTARENP
ncbi:MAG: protein kinase [Planctomycetes bacterium]|nr:protein kinase [Planctomycetota bacterium]